jgi:2-polyprenyl-3-methyl-5-hydroxy-6-metoxy-1,4-benzoquinol methylase
MSKKTFEMNKLNVGASEYKPGAATYIENDLILNWYPKRILKHLKGSGARSLLKLGVGHGFTAQLFHQYFDRHVILEASSVVIDLFYERNHDDIEVVHTFFEKFETDEKFDVILMGFVLEHVDDPGLIVKRFKQNLAPEGRIFIAVPNAKSLNRRLGLKLGMINDIYKLNANDHALGHQRQFCRDTLSELLITHGFKITWEEGIYLKPLPLRYMESLPRFQDNLKAMLEVGVDYPDLCVGLLVEVKWDE